MDGEQQEEEETEAFAQHGGKKARVGYDTRWHSEGIALAKLRERGSPVSGVGDKAENGRCDIRCVAIGNRAEKEWLRGERHGEEWVSRPHLNDNLGLAYLPVHPHYRLRLAPVWVDVRGGCVWRGVAGPGQEKHTRQRQGNLEGVRRASEMHGVVWWWLVERAEMALQSCDRDAGGLYGQWCINAGSVGREFGVRSHSRNGKTSHWMYPSKGTEGEHNMRKGWRKRRKKGR